MRHLAAIISMAALTLVGACAGSSQPPDGTATDTGPADSDTTSTPPPPTTYRFHDGLLLPDGVPAGPPRETPGGEMLPMGAGLPAPVVLDGPAEQVGTSRDELFGKAKEALAARRFDVAAGFMDVHLIAHPEDAEAIELRALALEAGGDPESAAFDRSRCCKLGRPSCCTPPAR